MKKAAKGTEPGRCAKANRVGRRRMTYTCFDYRVEMRLLGLRKRLQEEDLDEGEKTRISREIEELEKTMEMN